SEVKQIRLQEASRLRFGSWSPDGHRFTYQAVIDGTADIYTAAENGASVVRVTSGGSSNVEPCWSPDGNWIYYSSNRTGRYEVWKSSPQGGPAFQITYKGGTDPQAGLDGKYLYYLDPLARPRSDAIAWTATLKRVPVGGGEETVLLESVRPGLWG